jgi:hypothetical protein
MARTFVYSRYAAAWRILRLTPSRSVASKMASFTCGRSLWFNRKLACPRVPLQATEIAFLVGGLFQMNRSPTTGVAKR